MKHSVSNLAEASSLYLKKQYAEAIPVYLKAKDECKSDKENIVILCNIGHCQYGLKKYSEAINYYSDVIKIDQQYLPAYKWRAISYKRLADATSNTQQKTEYMIKYKRDLSTQKKITDDSDKQGSESAYQEAMKFYDLGQYSKAIKNFTKAISYYTKNKSLFNRDQMLRDAYCNRGNSYHLLGHNTKARNDYNNGIKIDPNFAKLYTNRSATFINDKQHQAVINDCNKAIQLNLNDSDSSTASATYYNLGVAHYALGKDNKAIEYYNHAIKIDPNDPAYYQSLGKVYYKQKNYNQAIKNYSQSIKLNPKNQDVYSARANIYYDLDKYKLAVQDYNQALMINPNNTDAYFGLANTYHCLKEYKNAIQMFKEILRLQPKAVGIYSSIGNTYSAWGKYQQAKLYYLKGLSFSDDSDPHSASAVGYYNLANACFDLKEYSNAIKHYSKAIQLDSKDADFYFRRGGAYTQLKQYERAKTDYKLASELDPKQYKKNYLEFLKKDIQTEKSDDELAFQSLSL